MTYQTNLLKLPWLLCTRKTPKGAVNQQVCHENSLLPVDLLNESIQIQNLSVCKYVGHCSITKGNPNLFH